MGKKIAILGGGVAGLSAAHELVERGFEVHVYEASDVPGGKARSMQVPGSATPGHDPLPGEHGFRFFPGFYRHLPDTMTRIPYAGNANGVKGNLRDATQFQIARTGASDLIYIARFPRTIKELYTAIRMVFEPSLGIPDDDILFFVDKIFTILTSCQERRLAEYETITWWDFLEADTRSQAYRDYLVVGLTRSLVAMKPKLASTRTVGDIFIQLMLDLGTPCQELDRLLDGPTNDVWIDPWMSYLNARGVTYHTKTPLLSVAMAGGQIASVTVDVAGTPTVVTADAYVLALPVERVVPFITPDMVAADPIFGTLDKLNVSWMNGIQFYLKRDIPLVRGHTIYVNTPWALTSVSQQQFWKDDISRYGDGSVKGILSVDVSDWTTPGVVFHKPAQDLTSADDIKTEVWTQLKDALDGLITDADLVTWFLDTDIRFPGGPTPVANLEPLLVNTVGSWQYRPEATTKIPNLFLAADYVRTYTDLATMEGANEAARRAVNAIIDYTSTPVANCEIWPLEEPEIFAPLRAWDWVRFEMGLPHGRI
jgi:uncharacterized protein with NAD-binding domain and iron-sulfur cluster